MSNGPILLVDDSDNDVLLTRRAFAKNGVPNPVVAAPDADTCYALLLPEGRAAALHPLLVLLDVDLPRVGGLDVLSRLRSDERTRTLPVIMLTTSREEHEVAECYRLGANGFVRKPVRFGDFLGAVDALARYWLRVNEPPPGCGGR